MSNDNDDDDGIGVPVRFWANIVQPAEASFPVGIGTANLDDEPTLDLGERCEAAAAHRCQRQAGHPGLHFAAGVEGTSMYRDEWGDPVPVTVPRFAAVCHCRGKTTRVMFDTRDEAEEYVSQRIAGDMVWTIEPA